MIILYSKTGFLSWKGRSEMRIISGHKDRSVRYIHYLTMVINSCIDVDYVFKLILGYALNIDGFFYISYSLMQ